MTDKRWDTHVTWWREPESEDITFTGRVNMRDLARLRLDHVERAALRTAPATAAKALPPGAPAPVAKQPAPAALPPGKAKK